MVLWPWKAARCRGVAAASLVPATSAPATHTTFTYTPVLIAGANMQY